ncbi:MAG: HAD hydrolase-like protein [Zoogloeaceae bacterium]|jgi:phosphoglycolate phosphatase|nr:HAD hydrolase-like protein [Zoogloeaceae bacterium]
MNRDILFDLDGTLIDSSPGILASFARVLAQHGVTPTAPLEAGLIGPPLIETLRKVCGIDDEARLRRLADAFKADYDTEGCRATPAFPGVAAGLAQLADAGARLYIVTNKRGVPTRRILQTLDLARHFTGIHTRDETDPPAPSKAVLTARLISHYRIDPARACFVGDTHEDADAARQNALPFIHAAYGYGAAGIAAHATLQRFADLPSLINAWP